jgi:hypothetical protein
VDSLYWGPFRVSQMLAAISCLAGVIALLVLSFKPHDSQKLFVNRVAQQVAAQKENQEEDHERTE